MKRENVEAIIFEHLQIQISSFWSKEGFVPILHMWHSRSWHEQYNLSMMIHRIYLTHSGRDVFLDWEELGGSKEKVKFQSSSNTFSPEEIFLNYNLITFYIYIHSRLIMQKWCCTWNDAYGHTRWRDELCKAVNHFLSQRFSWYLLFLSHVLQAVKCLLSYLAIVAPGILPKAWKKCPR